MKQQTTVWTCQVPTKLDAKLKKALSNSTMKTKSEFIRDSVRRTLEKIEV